MSILYDNTHWVFISGMSSEKKNKDRFLNDIFFGIVVLINKSVPITNIDILLDPNTIPSDPIVKEIFSRFTIKNTSDYKEVIENKSSSLDNLMLVFTGHGSINGIDSSSNLKPFELIDYVHSTNKKEIGVIFGQCFAGIYNYINVINKDKYQKLCLLGASHLNSSLSSPVSINYEQIPMTWIGNVFLFNFFNWILSPVDIDGDSKTTLIDAFKYSGAQTSEILVDNKKTSFLYLYNLSFEMKNLQEKLAEEIDDDKIKILQLEIKSIEIEIVEYTMITHINQDPWILNANAAREIEFH